MPPLRVTGAASALHSSGRLDVGRALRLTVDQTAEPAFHSAQVML